MFVCHKYTASTDQTTTTSMAERPIVVMLHFGPIWTSAVKMGTYLSLDFETDGHFVAFLTESIGKK
jgi:hypothetical protein